MSNSEILIVGLGLIGGSYAKGLTRLGYHVYAIDPDAEAVSYAKENGIIEDGSTEADPKLIQKADAAIFALYPSVFVRWIKEHGNQFKEGTLLTDVTGVKSCVVYEVQKALPKGIEFIGAHPMAGREVSGIKNADERIFLNANYIVTPTEQNTPEAIEWCKSLGKLLGFRHIAVLSPEEHDEMIGFVSQLTHCIAVTLMTCNDNRHLVDYTGDSFRDLTRISRINETMWSELFLMNKAKLLEQMDLFIRELSEMRTLLEAEDREGLKEKMKLSTERRAYFDN
ncbi:MAG: prephenate dehydrogenase [Clostridia bacterium]|nr:prephenate dehydrogenase [Clostridia bacterium]